MNKHDRAKIDFWKVVDAKTTSPGPIERQMTDVAKLKDAINYMLDKLPTWAVEKATGWMKDWQP